MWQAVVPSVEAARVALIPSAFDVVVVDYDLDDGKGTEVIALAKELTPRVGIVAASSHRADRIVLAGCPGPSHRPPAVDNEHLTSRQSRATRQVHDRIGDVVWGRRPAKGGLLQKFVDVGFSTG